MYDTASSMKTVRALVTSDGAARWGYLAFTLTMLHLVRRARNKDVVKEVRVLNALYVVNCSY